MVSGQDGARSGRPGRGARALAVLVALVLTASACGTRMSDEAVKAGVTSATDPAAVASRASDTGAASPAASGSGTRDPAAATTPTTRPVAGADTVTSVPGRPTGPSGGAPSATKPNCTGQESPVVIGQVTEASGIMGQNTGSSAPVVAAWAKHVNDAYGGLACHKVKLLLGDDQSDPGRAAAFVDDFVNRGAVGFVGNFVQLSVSGFRSAINKHGTPAVGGDGFAADWTEDPLMYPVGTGFKALAFGTMASLAQTTGAKKVAVIYCIESAACPLFFRSIRDNAASIGASVVHDAGVSITSTDFTAFCQNAKNAGATQITALLDGSSISRLGRSCASIGYAVPFAVGSLGATFTKTDPNLRSRTVTLASSVQSWFDSGGGPGQAEFLAAMRDYVPNLGLDPASVLAWSDGMMLKAALDRLGAEAREHDITPAMIRRGLAMLKGETLGGLVAPTTFDPSRGANAENPCWFPVVFGHDGRFTAPLGARFQCLGSS
jgi:branched-chain amino acid transport system substrate-binding protein